MERVEAIREVRTKELPTGVTLYLVKDSEGREYSTRNRDLARVADAARLSGQYVHIDYDEKKNDRGFTNRYLNEVEPVNDGTPGNEPDRQPPGLFDDAAPPEFAPSPAPNPEADRNEMIAKQVALKAGVEILQYLPEDQRTVANVVTAAEFFTRWLVTWRP